MLRQPCIKRSAELGTLVFTQVPYSSKPWAYLCSHPWRDAFFKMLDGTPWAGWHPPQAQVAEALLEDMARFLSEVHRQHADFDTAACLEACCAALKQQLEPGTVHGGGCTHAPAQGQAFVDHSAIGDGSRPV